MAPIRTAVQEFTGNDELANTQKELVSTLAALAESKADHYEAEVTKLLLEAGTAGNWTIPITTVLKTSKHTHAYTTDSAKDINDKVQDALKSFVAGGKKHIVNGVGTLVTGAITAFLGEASASTGEMSEYYVMTEGLSIVRVDVYGWYLNVEAATIKQNIERVSAFVAFKSAVDVSKLDYNTFLNLYQDQLFISEAATAEQVADEMEDLYTIFEKFKGLQVETQSIKTNGVVH